MTGNNDLERQLAIIEHKIDFVRQVGAYTLGFVAGVAAYFLGRADFPSLAPFIGLIAGAAIIAVVEYEARK